MRREIGSEFWDIPINNKITNSVIPSCAQWFLSGRMALSCIIQDIQKHRTFRTVSVPSWCCHSMIEPFVRHGIEVRFYPVYPDRQGQLIQDLSQVHDCDALLVMDYFGYVRPVERDAFDGVVIRDVTHSLFCGVPDDADYVFGSLRKWAGFLTGGYGWKRSGERQQAMTQKEQYIRGDREDKDYLSLFTQAEELLERQTNIFAAAHQDIDAAQQLNTEFIRSCRRENAAILLETVKDMALFPEIRETDCPLFVPILVPNEERDALRKHLIAQNIYCPVHWPISELHGIDDRTKRIYQEELSLVCDQRYSTLDMERLCTAVREFLD